MAIKLAIYEGAPPESLSTQYVETLSYFFAEAISLQTKKDADSYVDRSSIKGGNGMLPEKIASHLGPRLNLNKCLVQVSRNNEGVFILTFDNDQKIRADILVLAIPCSMYKDIGFEETVIPFDKLQFIHAIKYGTNSKILIPFDNTKEKTLCLVSDHVCGNFDSSRGVLAINFTGKMTANPEKEFADIYALAKPMIERVFNQSFAIPLCAEDRSFATYSTLVGYSWLNDPYVKGSYSYISPGQENVLMSITEENEEKFKTLFAPIQGLYFAGEHASISDIPGTMEAACESGERIARAILKTR
jgi:monoamine oxidase